MRESKGIQSQHKRFVSTKEIGPLLGVSPRTIRNWVKRGDIKAHKIGHCFKITRREAVRILRRYEQPIPKEW
jgi:excisionase family DNA binding protein